MKKYKTINFQAFKTVNSVFRQLLQYMPEEYHNIKLRFTSRDDASSAGYAADNKIVIGSEFMEKWREPFEIAELLGHELGHHVLGHISAGCSSNRSMERDADQFGLFLCQMAGFKRKDIINHFEQFLKEDETDKERISFSHGSSKERLYLLRKQDTYLKQSCRR